MAAEKKKAAEKAAAEKKRAEVEKKRAAKKAAAEEKRAEKRAAAEKKKAEKAVEEKKRAAEKAELEEKRAVEKAAAEKKRATEKAAAEKAASTLPKAAKQFVGTWKLKCADNYAAFLRDVVGLGRVLRKVAERIVPYPVFSIVDGKLVVETMCKGAKTVHETLTPGDSSLHEPNLKVVYSVHSWWDGAAFVASRRSDAINGGRPTVQRRWLSGPDELTITQDWGGPKPFTAVYTRAKKR